MKKCVFGIALLCTTSVQAQDFKDASYFCTVEMAGGISYDGSSKRWQSTIFNPSGKFVLRLKFEHAKMEKLFSFSELEKVGYYSISMTNAGTNSPSVCRRYGGDTTPHVQIRDGYFYCSRNLTDYKFNLRTNRFVSSYMVGYIDGEDKNDNTPAITAGTCTKID